MFEFSIMLRIVEVKLRAERNKAEEMDSAEIRGRVEIKVRIDSTL